MANPAPPSTAPADDDSPTFFPGETPAEKDRRMRWWREARFGMFIHWGLYAVPAGIWNGKEMGPRIGEWIQHELKIPVADYARLTAQFNPVKYDADAWVRLAKEAGMKYIIITSKHHDGFALFKSTASAFNIVDATPFKRDPLKELAAACQRHGLKLGFYYSQAQDWHHAGGAASGGQWDPAQQGDMTEYIRTIAIPQVKEILTHYGPIAVLWWDTPTDMTRERADLLAPLVKLQPGIITNNRLGGGYLGDTETPENRVPATGYPRDWEACMTMNDTWGFKSYDHNWKSSEALIRHLVDIVSKGGNYLLNVGPTAEGEIPAPSIERLKAIGAWLRQNGDAIYATKASPFQRLGWGRATQKPDQLYLHVFDWPTDGTLVVPMRSGAKKAYLLSDPGKTLAFTSANDGLRIQVPPTAPDPISTTIVLEGVGAVDPLPPPPIQANSDGGFTLLCDAADLIGQHFRIEGNVHLNLGRWSKPDDYLQWHVQFPTAGTYDVALTYLVTPSDAGGEFVLSLGDQELPGRTQATRNYETVPLGQLRITRAGEADLVLRPIRIPGSELMRFRSLTLTPVAPR